MYNIIGPNENEKKRGLKQKAQDYYDTIEESLEANIAKLCRHQYDELLLEKIFSAYCMLDKCETFFDNLDMNTMNSVNVVACETLIGIVVNSFVLVENLTSNTKENLVRVNTYIDELKKREFQNLFNVRFVYFPLISFLLNLFL